MIEDSDFLVDTTSYEEARSFDVVPKGDYVAVVSGIDVVATKDKGAGAGKQLVVTVTIDDGEYKGRKLWGRHTMRNASTKAVEIGMGQIKQLLRAVGLPDAADVRDTQGRPVVVHVGIDAAEGDYPARNKVSGYKPVGGVTPAVAPTKNETKRPAWAKK